MDVKTQRMKRKGDYKEETDGRKEKRTEEKYVYKKKAIVRERKVRMDKMKA